MRRYLDIKEAISLLPDTDEIHTFYQMGGTLVGADWDRADILQKLAESDKIEITGKQARSMGHGLAVYSDNTKWQSEILFIETDEKKLDAFDPPSRENTLATELQELISVFLEDKGYDVDYSDGVLFVNAEDTNTGVKITVEVEP